MCTYCQCLTGRKWSCKYSFGVKCDSENTLYEGKVIMNTFLLDCTNYQCFICTSNKKICIIMYELVLKINNFFCFLLPIIVKFKKMTLQNKEFIFIQIICGLGYSKFQCHPICRSFDLESTCFKLSFRVYSKLPLIQHVQVKRC